jgi:hypothetical protein
MVVCALHAPAPLHDEAPITVKSPLHDAATHVV